MKFSIYCKYAVFCMVLAYSVSATNQSFAIGNPFKAVLDGLANRANAFLNQATNNGLILETTAAEQALQVIANAQEAYKKELSATSHVIQNKEQQFISGVQEILDQIQNHTIKDVATQISQIALLLPWLGNDPQLSSWTGNILIQNQINATIKLEGIFKYASVQGYEPTITIGDKNIKGVGQNTTRFLSFDIPMKQFKFLPNNVSYIPVEIALPYKNHFWQGKQLAKYKIKLILLPVNPGKFEFMTNTYVEEIKTIPGSCDLSWSGHEDLIKNCFPDPGYLINIESITKTLIGETGKGFGHDHWDLGTAYSHTAAGIHIRCDGDESSVAYRIKYTMSKTELVPVDKSEGEEVFKWGDSKIYTVQGDQATWKAVYTQFDSRKVAFASSSESNPYVRVRQVANNIIVSFAPFE